MKLVHWLLGVALSLISVEGKPVNCTTKTLSFPLLRQHTQPAAYWIVGDRNGTGSIRVSDPVYNYAGPILYGVDSLVYTIEVAVGGPQRFNLTLDTNAQAAVLFAKGYVYAPNTACRYSNLVPPYNASTGEDGDMPRNFIERELFRTFHDSGNSFSGWGLYRLPYVSRHCGVSLGQTEKFQGTWATDTEPANHESPAPGGEITSGGKDTRNCADQWTTIPSANTADWSVPLHSVISGGNVTVVYNRERSGYARISLATPFIEVPSAKVIGFFHDFLSFATHRPRVDVGLQPHQLTFNCSLTDSMPAITINIGSGFGSIYYTVPAKEYVARYPQFVCGVKDQRYLQEACNIQDPPVCGLLIVEKLPQAISFLPGSEQATPDPDDVWVIGSQFLPKRCVHLDYANGDPEVRRPAATRVMSSPLLHIG